MKKSLGERVDESVLQWFGLVERMEKDRITKRVYVGKCAGSHSVGMPRKRWIDSLKECLKKRVLGIRQARRMVQDRSEWVCEGECMQHSLGDESRTLMRCYSYMKPMKGGSPSVAEPTTFLLFLKLCFSFTLAHFMA